MATVTLDKKEYNSILDTLKYYKEILDTYDAISIAEKEKKSWKLKKLKSLKSLIW